MMTSAWQRRSRVGIMAHNVNNAMVIVYLQEDGVSLTTILRILLAVGSDPEEVALYLSK